jgi:hypothetical protein
MPLCSFHYFWYLQHMLKMQFSVKDIEIHAAKLMENLLREIPSLKLKTLQVGSHTNGMHIDVTVRVDISGEAHLLVCEVKRNGQPRFVREAIYQLQSYVAHLKQPATAILIAPYLSPASRELCQENGISFLDFEGNARVAFGTVFIDHRISDKPTTERREFKSMFTPKSAQVLRVLLRDPERTWRVTDLAVAANVSLGHVSNVRSALLDREWAQVVPEGLRLSSPDALLDAWKSSYVLPVGQLRFYTTQHGSAFEKSVRELFLAIPQKAHVALASYSAAQWIAPYARTGTHFFYADETGVGLLQKGLELSSTAKGENVLVFRPKDEGVFLDLFEPLPGLRCTSPVQTYLDLSKGGERGEEAADHLRRTRLTWQK